MLRFFTGDEVQVVSNRSVQGAFGHVLAARVTEAGTIYKVMLDSVDCSECVVPMEFWACELEPVDQALKYRGNNHATECIRC